MDKIRYLKEMKEFYDEVEKIGVRMGNGAEPEIEPVSKVETVESAEFE